MDDNNYYLIQGYMVSKLGLKGLELSLYAIINGFSQDGKSSFKGSLAYLSDWTGADRSSIQRVLKNLVERGLLIKEEYIERKVKKCSYKVKEGVLIKYQRGIDKISTDNKEDNIKREMINDRYADNRVYKLISILGDYDDDYTDYEAFVYAKLQCYGYSLIKRVIRYFVSKKSNEPKTDKLAYFKACIDNNIDKILKHKEMQEKWENGL